MKPDPFDGVPVPVIPRKHNLQADFLKCVQAESETEELYTCSRCKKPLVRANFYTYPNGGRYKTCKRCTIARNNLISQKGEPMLAGGISYKKALPPEQWGAMEHFLRSLLYCADVAAQGGVKPDVGAFMTAYKGGLE